MAQTEIELLWSMEQLGRAAIQTYHDKGVELKLFEDAYHSVIMDALQQDAEQKMVDEIQKHFDEHFEKKEPCPDLEQLEKMFKLEVNTEGRTIVVSRIKTQEAMN